MHNGAADLRSLPPLPACLACRQIVKQIDLWGIDMVFVVGGNGGNAGAAAIQEELEKNNIICRWGRSGRGRAEAGQRRHLPPISQAH